MHKLNESSESVISIKALLVLIIYIYKTQNYFLPNFNKLLNVKSF